MALPVPSENLILDTKPLLGYSSERSSYPPRPIPPSNPHVAFSTLVFTVTWAVTSNAIHCATYSIIFSMVGYYALGRRARDAWMVTYVGTKAMLFGIAIDACLTMAIAIPLGFWTYRQRRSAEGAARPRDASAQEYAAVNTLPSLRNYTEDLESRRLRSSTPSTYSYQVDVIRIFCSAFVPTIAACVCGIQGVRVVDAVLVGVIGMISSVTVSLCAIAVAAVVYTTFEE